MKKFEYLQRTRKLSENELNSLGQEGWELVSHTAIEYENFWSSDSKQYYLFKREII